MSIFGKIFAGQPLIMISGEEARTVINALRRSREGMPDATETLHSREIRSHREAKIANRIGNLIEGGI